MLQFPVLDRPVEPGCEQLPSPQASLPEGYAEGVDGLKDLRDAPVGLEVALLFGM